ncbi:MAG: flagellar motor protein MotB [Burkholderiales bacterium]
MLKKIAVAVFAGTLLAACVSEQTYQTEVKKSNTYQALSQRLQSEVNADQVQITQLQNQLKVTMVDQLMFPEGGWQISRSGEQTLDKIVPVLKGLQGKNVIVQGFTDNVPIGSALQQRFPSNLELSTARASDVVRYLVSQGVPASELSAQGFGDTRPVASNDTPQGRAKNRRVEIIITSQNL